MPILHVDIGILVHFDLENYTRRLVIIQNLYVFNNFSCLIFDPKMHRYPQAQKYHRGKNGSIPSSYTLLTLASKNATKK